MDENVDKTTYQKVFDRFVKGRTSLVEEDLLFRKFTLSELKEHLDSTPDAKPRLRVKRRLKRIRRLDEPRPKAFYRRFSGILIIAGTIAGIFYLNKPTIRNTLAPHSALNTKPPKSPSLALFKKLQTETIHLWDGASVTKNDTLQIKYQSAGYTHGIIFSVGGQRQITLHHPKDILGSTELSKAELTVLTEPYILDDTPHFERFYFIASKSAFKVEDVWPAVLQATKEDEILATIPGIPRNYLQSSIALRKQQL